MPNELLDASSNATKGQLLAALGVMATAVSILFNLLFKAKHESEARLTQQNEKSDARWQTCEKKHAEAQTQMIEMTKDRMTEMADMAKSVGRLEGQISILSGDVLKRIVKEKSDADAGSGGTG